MEKNNFVVPPQVASFFKSEHFSEYPLVQSPQFFSDSRGEIKNIADGSLGDVAVITSKFGSVRANHTHQYDWHLSYLVDGEIKYYWEDDHKQNSMIIKPGELFYTPPKTPHKMVFLKESIFIAVAAMSRTQANYENDTTRLEDGYFH